jgi:hypothetical protein
MRYPERSGFWALAEGIWGEVFCSLAPPELLEKECDPECLKLT